MNFIAHRVQVNRIGTKNNKIIKRKSSKIWKTKIILKKKKLIKHDKYNFIA